MLSRLQPTLLPPLHTSRVREEEAEATGQRRRHWVDRLLDLDIATAPATACLEEHLISAFHRFVWQLLGGAQDNVCCFVMSESAVCSGTTSRSDGSDGIELVEELDELASDFLLDLRGNLGPGSDPTTQDATDSKFIAQASRTSHRRLHIRLGADANLVPLHALQHLASLFSHQILGRSQDAETQPHLSVLNHPPRERPSPFPQEPGIEQYPALLHGCFERRVAQFPQRLAIDFLTSGLTRQQYSYLEVDAIARRIATTLANNDNDSHAKSPLAIVMGPSPEMYISYLAALQSGRPFCPVPIDAPIERQLVILRDLGSCAILTRDLDSTLPLFAKLKANELLQANIPVINASIYLSSSSFDAVQHVSAEPRTTRVAEDDLAYIMYTSGTTGKPKGVQISHLSAACSIAAHASVAPLSSISGGRPTRWFQFAAPTFDPSIMEIFVTLSSGGTLCSAERQLTLDNINAVLSQMEIDVMMATPSLASLLDPQQLKSLWTMGETLSTRVITNFAGKNPDDADDWNATAGPRGLYNGYGPTEAAINCTLLAHVPRDNRGSILGPALPSCCLIIVDEKDHFRPVPWGCAGELLIAGPQVSSRGYLNRPEETDVSFLPCTPWGRAYRTGDRARIVCASNSGEASVEFLGRISSDQVKLSGRRVELGEIDAVIMGSDAVREALTVVYKPYGSETGGSEKPVAVVSLANDECDWDAVRSGIQSAVDKHLPPFMRPYRILFERQLPRSPAGKLDRKALTLLVHDRIQVEATEHFSDGALAVGLHVDLSPELAEVEVKLLDILSSIVGTRPSATSDLVHDVGLDSLRAMQFLSRVRAEQLAESMSLQDLLSGNGIRQLLLQKSNRRGHGNAEVQALLQQFSTSHFHAACELAGLRPQDVDKVLPSTATQSGVIASFIRSSHGAQKTYINHSCYSLNTDSLDVTRLITAIEATLVAREAFRTTFVPVDDTLAPFAQCIITQQAARDDCTWCRVIQRDGSEGILHWLQQAEKEISLENNSLYSFQIVNNETMLISLFHGIFDGASLELLLVDIGRHYRGLPAEPRSDISLAAQLHFSALSKDTDDFWLKETADYQADTTPALSGTKARRPIALVDPDTRVLHHKTELRYADLQDHSREIDASPLSVWQTAWALLLSSFSESQTGDVMFGSVVSNRFDGASTVCHGPLFSMLPCRVQVQVATEDGLRTTVGQLAAKVARTSTRILGHPHPSLGLITTPEGKLPFDSLLALQHFEVNGKAEHEDEHEEDPLWNHISWPAVRNDFGIMLEVWPYDPHMPRCRWRTGDPMMVKMTYKTDLLSEEAATRVLDQLSSIVGSILSNPNLTSNELLGSLPQRLLSAENVNASKVQDGTMLLHAQFELEAVTNPDKPALIFRYSLVEPALEFTYGELNARADAFARRLHRHFNNEAPIDKIIPICLEKSPELYVAVLGILKAGAAWCPVDTTFPAQRKLELIKRTESSLLVSSKASQQLAKDSLPDGTALILTDEMTPGTEPLDHLAPMKLLPEHLAYMIWTSGTTGAPKGVMIAHTAVVHTMRALQESIPTSINKTTGQPCPPRVLNFCAYSFDVFVQDLFYTWGLGGTLISSTREIMLGNFVELATSMQATHAFLTPSFAASVRRKELGDALQVVTMLGEKLTEQVANDWSWETKAFNSYGPAENAVISTQRQFFGIEDLAKAANVGRPLASVSSFVVRSDPPHQLVPLHGVGELALGGHQLARGYFNDPVKTNARFVWSEHLQQRIYLTGDIVRMVDHGIEFLGRNDDLIKLNGIRVELSEISATLAGAGASRDIEHIETLLLAHPNRPVKAVVSFASLRGNGGDVPLVAIDSRAYAMREQIVDVAHQLLPDYMVPSSLVLLNRMPRTASNKVDRTMLQHAYEALDLERLSTHLSDSSSKSKRAGRRTRARTLLDQKVVGMLSKLAGVDAGGITDDMSLARLGIHSILAIRLAWQLKQEADVGIAVVDLLTCSTIGQLLDKVSYGADRGGRNGNEERQKASRWLDDVEQQLVGKFGEQLSAVAITKALSIEALRPATTMQESLVVETLRNDRSYWSHRMFRLPDVDLGRLRAAWEQVTKDNDILRTSFVIPAELDADADAMKWLKQVGANSAIVQAVTAPAPAMVRWSEVEWDPAAASDTFAATAAEEARRARNEASPIASAQLVCPWSISILRNVATGEKTMMWHIHHALHDAYSMHAILDDVCRHYQARSSEVVSRTQFGEAMQLGLYLAKEQRNPAQEHPKELELYGDLVEELGPISTTKCPDLTASRHSPPHQILRTSAKIAPAEHSDLWSSLQVAMTDYNLGSPAQIILAAFGCVLAEYLESKYVVLGETVSQRLQDAQLQTAIGPLIATVPRAVRIDITAAHLLSSLASKSIAAVGAMSHIAPTPLRSLLGIPSDQPLYPALVVYHPHVGAGEAAGNVDEFASGFWSEMDDIVGLRVEHPLALNIFEQQSCEGVLLELSGDNQVISMRQLDLMLSQVMSQLAQMLTRPNVLLDRLNTHLPRPLLSITPAEGTSMRALQAVVQNASGWKDIADPTFNPMAWVEYHARHHPDWIAAEEIVELDEPEEIRRWTYSQLLDNSLSVLAALQEHNVPKSSVVSLHLGRTLESFAAIIALFRGQYIYLPLDEDLPPERTRMLTRDAGARAFITTRNLWAGLVTEEQPGWADDLALLLLDGVFDQSDLRSVPGRLPQHASTERTTDDGYILYTSGSTGKPKGVRVANSSLCTFVESFAKRILDSSPRTADLAGVGKYLNLASRAFDPHLTHMLMAWRLGFAATIGPRMMMLGSLEHVIVQNSITHFGTVPSVLQQARLSPDRVPSVVFVTVGGEKVSNDVLDMWTHSDSSNKSRPVVMNVYGPTECTIGCTSNVIDGHSNARNIGKVFDSATAIVIAKEECSKSCVQAIVKRGQPGELCIAGDLVSLGYMSRPEAQAKAFREAELPLGEDGSMQMTRLYRTGDLVRMMADGSIEYLGRSDQQAKVNGQRLELGEVEHFLRRTAKELNIDLEFVAAVVQHPELPRPRLFAFVADSPQEQKGQRSSMTSAGDVDIQAALSNACAKSLPAFMIPDLIWVDRIPFMKTSGKVDVKQLEAVVKSLPLSILHRSDRHSAVGLRGTSTASQTLDEHEEVVVQAIEHVLGQPIERPSADRSIYELGLDSLSAVQLSARLKQLGFQVTAANVLNDATIRNLAQRRKVSISANTSAAAVQRAKQRVELFGQTHQGELVARLGDIVQQVLPTMPLQSALLARSMAQIEDDGDDATSGVPYVTHFRYSLSASTDLQRFTNSVQAVLQETEMLRTCFCQLSTGEIAQVVLAETPTTELVTKAAGPCDEWYASNMPNTIARALVHDIERLPPVRVHVFSEGSAEVLISMHHSLFDGEAIKQLRSRIEEHYDNDAISKTIEPSASQLVAQLEAGDNIASKTFWQENLAEAVPCLVDDGQGPGHRTNTVARSKRRLPLPLSVLQKAAQVSDTSLNALFQTVFALLLSETVPSRPEVVFGAVLSLRPLFPPELGNVERLIVPCLNTLPQRVKLPYSGQNDRSLRDLARSVRKNLSATTQHAFTPLNHILRWCHLDQALFDAIISVNMHSQQEPDGLGEPSDVRPGGMTLKDTISVTNVPFAADINIHHRSLGDGYVDFELSSNAQRFDAGKLAMLAQRFEDLCSLLVERPETQVSSILRVTPGRILSKACSGYEAEDTDGPECWSTDELLVRDVVCALLKVQPEHLSKQESFYRLGLDSILVLRLVKLLRGRAGVKLSHVAVLRARSVAAVAKLIGAARESALEESEVSPASRQHDYDNTVQRLLREVTHIEDSYLATPMQQGMLSAGLSQTAEAGEHASPYVYRHTFQLQDRSSFHFESFEKAWGRTVDQVEILRTTFHFTGDRDHPWLGVVRRFKEDLHAVEIFKSAGEAVNTPLDIVVSLRLARCILVIPDALSEPVIVIFILHHAIYDGASLPLLWHKIMENYHDASRKTTNLVPKPASFSAIAKQIAVQQPQAVEYWARKLQGYTFEPLLPVATARRITRHRSHAIVPLAEFDGLRRKCREVGVTIQAALVLAWSKVLAVEVLGQTDVVFGQVLNGQSISFDTGSNDEKGSVIGPTLNTVAMRITLTPGLSNLQALEMTQRLSEEAQQYQLASLRAVLNEWRSSTPLSTATTLFESLFLFNGGDLDPDQGSASQHDFWRPTTLETISDQDGFTEYPLVCNLAVSQNGLHVRISAASSKLDSSAADRVRAYFKATLFQQMADLDGTSVAAGSTLQRGEFSKKDQASVLTQDDVDTGPTGEGQALCNIVLQAFKDLVQGDQGPQVERAIDAHTNLFSVGLDSILAIRLSSKLRQTKVPLTVNGIMQGKTVAVMVANKSQASTRNLPERDPTRSLKNTAVELLDQSQEVAAVTKLGWPLTEVESVLPCLAGQECHLENWTFAGHRFFEAPWIYKLRKSISAADVRGAWDKLRSSHPITRTTFVTLPAVHDGGRVGVVQVTRKPNRINDAPDGSFKAIQDKHSATLDSMIVQHLHESNNRPSDLMLPPAQLAFLQTSQGDVAIVMRLHHAMYDAWSIRSLLRDLDTLLAGREIAHDLSHLGSLVRDILKQRNRDEERTFWSQALKSAQNTILPALSTNATNDGPLGPQHVVRLPSVVSAATVRSLEIFCQGRAGSSLSPGILFAFAQTLAEKVDLACSSPTFGFYHASRSLGSLDLTRAAMPTMTHTPLSIEIGATKQVRDTATTVEVIQGVQNYLGQLTQFGQASMHDVLDSIGKGNEPLFNASINLLYGNRSGNNADQASSTEVLERFVPSSNSYFTESEPKEHAAPGLQGLETRHIPSLRIFVDVMIDKEANGISLVIRCDRGLYDVEHVHQFAGRFVDNIIALERVLSGEVARREEVKA